MNKVKKMATKFKEMDHQKMTTKTRKTMVELKEEDC
jgi:hypothetical protein